LEEAVVVLAWGKMAAGAAPQRSVKIWYEGIHPTTTAEIAVHKRMADCTGVPVYRVVMKTKKIELLVVEVVVWSAVASRIFFAFYVKSGSQHAVR
jgi:purine nucleoside phosphorylase